MVPGGRVILIAAAVFIDRAGRTLLVRKHGFDLFMQPGGKIDAGETPKQALLRELREEIGLDAREADFTYAGLFSEAAANEPGATVKAHTFLSFLPVTARPAAEIAEALWLPLEGEAPVALAELTQNHMLPLARRAFAAERDR